MIEEVAATETQGADSRLGGEVSESFAIPEAYQEKKWAQNIKSSDDLWREVDTLQPLIGKKTIPDADSSEEDWNKFHDNFRPESPEGYEFDFGEGATVNEEVLGKYKEVFHKLGMSNDAAFKLIQAHSEIEGSFAPDTSEEGFKTLTEDAFGENAGKVIANANSLIKDLPEDQAKAIQMLPNDQLVSVLSLVSKVHDKYSREDAPISNAELAPSVGRDEILSKMQSLRTEIRDMDVMDRRGRDAKTQELNALREKLQRIENK